MTHLRFLELTNGFGCRSKSFQAAQATDIEGCIYQNNPARERALLPTLHPP
jgi:hypothetical protein